MLRNSSLLVLTSRVRYRGVLIQFPMEDSAGAQAQEGDILDHLDCAVPTSSAHVTERSYVLEQWAKGGSLQATAYGLHSPPDIFAERVASLLLEWTPPFGCSGLFI